MRFRIPSVIFASAVLSFCGGNVLAIGPETRPNTSIVIEWPLRPFYGGRFFMASAESIRGLSGCGLNEPLFCGTIPSGRQQFFREEGSCSEQRKQTFGPRR